MATTTVKLNWQAIGVGVVVALSIVGFNAWCMNLVIDNAISKNMIRIMETYVTKAKFAECTSTLRRLDAKFPQ